MTTSPPSTCGADAARFGRCSLIQAAAAWQRRREGCRLLRERVARHEDDAAGEADVVDVVTVVETVWAQSGMDELGELDIALAESLRRGSHDGVAPPLEEVERGAGGIDDQPAGGCLERRVRGDSALPAELSVCGRERPEEPLLEEEQLATGKPE